SGTSPSSEVCWASSPTTCASDRRSSRPMRMHRRREGPPRVLARVSRGASHERHADHREWASSSLLVSREAGALAGGVFVCLSPADGAGVLVAVALLDRHRTRRPYGFARVASVGG